MVRLLWPDRPNRGTLQRVHSGRIRAIEAYKLSAASSPLSRLASRVVVQHDLALSPPGLRVVGNSNVGSGRAPFVLFDAVGFRRIAVSLRWTAPSAASNGLGFFWKSA